MVDSKASMWVDVCVLCERWVLKVIKSTILPTVKSHFYGLLKVIRSLGHSIEKDSFLPGRRKFAINFQNVCSQNVKQK